MAPALGYGPKYLTPGRFRPRTTAGLGHSSLTVIANHG